MTYVDPLPGLRLAEQRIFRAVEALESGEASLLPDSLMAAWQLVRGEIEKSKSALPVLETPAPTEILIFINHGKFVRSGTETLTLDELRHIPTPPIRDDHELWLVVPGEDDKRVDDSLTTFNGMRLFSAPRFINAGAPVEPPPAPRPTDEQIMEALWELRSDSHTFNAYSERDFEVYKEAIADAADIVSKMLLPLSPPIGPTPDDVKMEEAMDDFARNTTPGGTWIFENESGEPE